MPQSTFDKLFPGPFVIGMVHLLPLPGAPKALDLAQVLERALADADALVRGGCHGLMMENFGDAPFFPGSVAPSTLTMMTRIAVEIRRMSKLPLGINVLRNDGLGALSVAMAAEADFIRVNVLTGARVTDQGIIQGIAHDLLRARAQLGAQRISILADVDVKHSAPLAARPLADETQDAVLRGGADALVVSGAGTGKATDPAKLAQVKAAAAGRRVLVGSGVTVETLASLMPHADGFIVGTAFKKDGNPANPVDVTLVKRVVGAI